MWCIFPRVIQINTKFANFVELYFPHFTTFRGQTLQFYQFEHARSSCGHGFCSSCLDQNLVYIAGIIHSVFTRFRQTINLSFT
jgi:DNA-directed RNA polymerase